MIIYAYLIFKTYLLPLNCVEIFPDLIFSCSGYYAYKSPTITSLVSLLFELDTFQEDESIQHML